MRIRLAFAAVVLLGVPFSNAAVTGELESLSQEFFRLHGTDPGMLVQQAAAAYGEGDWSTAAEYYLTALMADMDDNPIALYNLACCYGLLDEEELAANALVLAVEAGFDRIDLVMTDTDLDRVRDGEHFALSLAVAEEILEERRLQSSVSILGDRLFLEFPSFQTVRVHLPDDFDPDVPHDLVLALHGYSGDVSEFSTRREAFEGMDFIFASLQAPYAFERNGRTVYSWTVYGSSPWDGQDMPEDHMTELYSGSMGLSSSMILACAGMLRTEYLVDDVFLLGFSQGGIMTYYTALRNPGNFAGIATFSGILGEEIASDELLESASSLPVFLGRGTQEDDRAVLARDRLLAAGFGVTFHEYEGGHYFPDSSLRAFQEWMDGIR